MEPQPMAPSRLSACLKCLQKTAAWSSAGRDHGRDPGWPVCWPATAAISGSDVTARLGCPGAIDLIAFPRSFAKLRIDAGAVRNGIECRFYGAKVAGVFIVGMRLAD